METLPYDPQSPDSILEYAKKLTGRTLAQVLEDDVKSENTRSRGNLGTLVQTLYFGVPADNKSEPDFSEANLELKTTGVVKRQDGSFQAKERLVLMMIDYENIVHERWEESSLLRKCRLILLIAYLYKKNVSALDLRFVLEPRIIDILRSDLPTIRRDWETIRAKVLEGKAHELSEGDTFFLGACRKGSGGPNEKLRTQPHSQESAKARAFSFKPGYVNQMLTDGTEDIERLIADPEQTIEEATQERFAPFIGKTIHELSTATGFFKQSKNHKGFTRQLVERILSDRGGTVVELQKAGIELKTIRLKPSGKPRESMSFPGFKYLEIVEQGWEESSFFERIERKFLFVIFKTGEGGEDRLHKVMFWNMPYADREEARRVWEETKRRVALGIEELPSIRESNVAHVRPKGRDGKDLIPTPQGKLKLKQCFWLNGTYIQSTIQT